MTCTLLCVLRFTEITFSSQVTITHGAQNLDNCNKAEHLSCKIS